MLRSTESGSVVPVTESLDGLSEIAEQMPLVSDLDGIWSALTDAVNLAGLVNPIHTRVY